MVDTPWFLLGQKPTYITKQKIVVERSEKFGDTIFFYAGKKKHFNFREMKKTLLKLQKKEEFLNYPLVN